IGVFDVSDRAFDAGNHGSDAFVPARAGADGPIDRGDRSDLGSPIRAHLGEVVGEDEGRAGTVGAMHHGDWLRRQLEVRIELSKPRVFHALISPRKILANVGPSSVRSPALTPSTFTTGTTPPITVGNCTSPCMSRSAAFSGISEAPNVTSLFWICLM